MSQENVEVVQRAIESLNDWRLDEDLYDPEVEYSTQPDNPNLTTYRGFAGLQQSLRSVREAWKSIEAEPRDFIQMDEVYVALVHFRLHAHSGVELEVDQGWAYWMRNGRIWRIEQYGSMQEALEAAGRQ
jgi:ketosteroid isomerase-like protein